MPAPAKPIGGTSQSPFLTGFGDTSDNGDDSEPILRTHLTDRQLEEFRDLLLKKRAELAGDVLHLTNEALNRQRDGGGDHSSMPIHMADLGTDAWEQEFTLGLAENERSRLREIDEALDRIEKRTYGICLATGRPITVARLRAQPWTRYSIEYARRQDEGRWR
jgi:DnaK suppressor protein